MTKSVREDNAGVWFGPGADGTSGGVPIPPQGSSYYCKVQQWLAGQKPPQATVAVLPQSGVAVRDEVYKRVRNSIWDYDPITRACLDAKRDGKVVGSGCRTSSLGPGYTKSGTFSMRAFVIPLRGYGDAPRCQDP